MSAEGAGGGVPGPDGGAPAPDGDNSADGSEDGQDDQPRAKGSKKPALLGPIAGMLRDQLSQYLSAYENGMFHKYSVCDRERFEYGLTVIYRAFVKAYENKEVAVLHPRKVVKHVMFE